eukprot:CAMPEP_0194195856 /NCGR_PEP_ID=MMETSP0154-20130528/76357_1 /TAXON_ID=1049557 /ORGANISM="Thalassiothrix antarctica, Strain L6-D1" /LENGTH=146 /DNA_ID=CAMNT_0038920411 /DNA_START=418 /DNA_END=854 /DNA_ORIENTATION=-
MNSTKHTLEEYEKHSKDRYSFRGLENRINSSKRKLVREGARSSVFQQIQTRNDDDEPASIAEQYCHYAKQCAFEAYDMGLMDEVEAFHIVNSPEFTTSKVMLSKIDSKCRKFPCSFQETGILESYMNTISICTIYDTYVPWKISLT